MFDLLVKGGTLPDGTVADIGITGDRIVAVGKLDATAGRVIDATGDLVAPPFVDPHFHMDATLSYGLPRVNASGTLLEGISLWGELREIATVDEMVDRALRYCDWAVSMGLLAIRTHVDTTPDHLRGVTAMLEVKRQVAPYLQLQLVAFPQDGLYRTATGRANLIRALDMGVDVVGGIPHFERTMAEGADSLRDLGQVAADRSLMWDVHCDETDDPMSRHVETMAREVTRHGLGGRAAGSHLTSMHSMDNYYVSKLLPLIAESGMTAIPNPLINITLQGRHDTYPKRRGLTRVKELQAMGIPVGWGRRPRFCTPAHHRPAGDRHRAGRRMRHRQPRVRRVPWDRRGPGHRIGPCRFGAVLGRAPGPPPFHRAPGKQARRTSRLRVARRLR